ncbi:uncharacterized protein [Macaca fascicularis]|uniref:uncharacterized protein n=1 Tax=Macaca fascicularis TaxID=9541 RepID=UPI003D158A3A
MAPKSKNFLNFIASFLQRFLGFACEAVSPRPRASERASQRGREGGRAGEAERQTERATHGQRRTATEAGTGTWETARLRGARCRARSYRDAEPRAGVAARKGRWLLPKLGERRGGGGAERRGAELGASAERSLGGERRSRRRGSRSRPRKSRLGGRGHALLALPAPRWPRSAPGPGGGRGEGRKGAVGKGVVQALEAAALARCGGGPRRALGAQSNQHQDE